MVAAGEGQAASRGTCSLLGCGAVGGNGSTDGLCRGSRSLGVLWLAARQGGGRAPCPVQAQTQFQNSTHSGAPNSKMVAAMELIYPVAATDFPLPRRGRGAPWRSPV